MSSAANVITISPLLNSFNGLIPLEYSPDSLTEAPPFRIWPHSAHWEDKPHTCRLCRYWPKQPNHQPPKKTLLHLHWQWMCQGKQNYKMNDASGIGQHGKTAGPYLSLSSLMPLWCPFLISHSLPLLLLYHLNTCFSLCIKHWFLILQTSMTMSLPRRSLS